MQSSFRGEGDHSADKHARQDRQEKSDKARMDKTDQAQRAAKSEKENGNDEKTVERPEDQARTAKEAGKQDPSRSSSEGAATGESGRSAEKKETERLGDKNKETTTSDHKDAAKRVEDAKRVEFSGDKRKQVVAALRERGDVKHRTNVKVDLRVGNRLPRNWLFLPVPLAVIDIVPEYRDYVFVYVDDDYLICDPDTYEIVAILPASGGPEYAGGDSHVRCTNRISLDADERDLILRSVRREDRVDVRHLTVGWSVPRDIELLKFPDRVLAHISELGPCRYFVADDQIAIVSPEEETVVLLIDRS